jgi:hypothetical protein
MNERAQSLLSGFREGTAVELTGGRRAALWRGVVASSSRPRRAPAVAVFLAGALSGALGVLALHRPQPRGAGGVEMGADDSRALVDRARRRAVLSAEVGDPVLRPSDLADQLALYKQAQIARSRGEAAAAAELLREYQRRFPDGVFAPEVAMALQQIAR